MLNPHDIPPRFISSRSTGLDDEADTLRWPLWKRFYAIVILTLVTWIVIGVTTYAIKEIF